jgi:hypothetical protein
MKRLHRNFVRCAGNVLFWMFVVTLIGYFWQGYKENHWWTIDYIWSLSIPFIIAPLFIWFAFVPNDIQFSENEFAINMSWGGKHTLQWSELEFFGRGRGVFLLQFKGMSAFQIYAKAYSKPEWNEFTSFIESRWPECKASGWLGPFGFKWRK